MSRFVDVVAGTTQAALLRTRGQEGQVLVEYTLILTLIVVLAVSLLGTVGDNVSTMLSRMADGF